MVSVIIPNFNGKHHLEFCLKSLEGAHFISEIIVVDNASKDESISFIKAHYPQVSIIKNAENNGFSKAVNQGICASKNEYVYLLNNDTKVEKNFLAQPLKMMQENPNFFSVNSLMLKMNAPTIIDGSGDAYTLFGWPYRRYRNMNKDKAKTERVFSSCAGATLYRKSMLLNLGLFDERFFAYLEDVDLGFRANIKGYQNWVCATSVVYHVEHGTSGKGKNEFKTKMSGRNSIYVFYKNYPFLAGVLNGPFFLMGIIVKYIHFRLLGLNQSFEKGMSEAFKNIKRIDIAFKKSTFTKAWLWIQGIIILDTMRYILQKIRGVFRGRV